MARGVNRVFLIGHLGKDPEVRYFPSGDAVANATIATTETWKDKQSGEQKEATEWHNVVFPGKLGEIAGKYLKKGSKVYVEGSLRTRKWTDKEGKDRYTTEIRVQDMQMLDGKPAGDSDQDRGSRRPAPNSSAAGAGAGAGAAQGHGPGAFEDDDIPFAPRSWKDS